MEQEFSIQTFEIERLVLNCLVLDSGLIDKVDLSESDFFDRTHRLIFRHIRRRVGAGKPADFLLLMDGYRQRHPEAADALSEIVRGTASPVNFKHYVEALQKKSAARRLTEVAVDIDRIARSGDETDEIMGRAQQALLSVTARQGRDIVEPEQYMSEFVDFLDALTHKAVGIPTGFDNVDSRLRGFREGDLIIVAARPAMGKTTYALNILSHNALAGRRVLVFSLEMSRNQLISKIVSNISGIPGNKFLDGSAISEPQFADALAQVKSSGLLIDDSSGLTIHRLCSKARRYAAGGKLDLIVVDYLGLIAGDTDSRYENVSRVSAGLKGLARELKVPVIALAQLNRGVEQRENKRPMLSDLRDSGSIEQDADIVQFLFRPDYYDPDPRLKGLAEVNTSKFRLGETGIDLLNFDGLYSRFTKREHLAALSDLPF